MELQAICKIGEINKKNILADQDRNEIMFFVENPNESGKYNTVLEIKFDSDCNYLGVNNTEFKEENILKYLYKKGASRGTDLSPTSKITEPEKTLSIKTVSFFRDVFKNTSYSRYKEITVVEGILKSMEENYESILKDIKKNMGKEGTILTVTYDNRYPGEFQLFRDIILEQSISNYYLIDKKKSIGKNSICSICKTKKDEVFGNANVFKFYTVDKKGYVSGGFNKLNSWKNFPVCKDCAISLELGKRYLDQNLSFKFQGRDFYLIPKLLYKKDLDRTLRIITNIDRDYVSKNYSATEKRLIKKLSNMENYVAFDLLFYEENNAALNIKLCIEEVLPSRFKLIHEKMTSVSRNLEEIKDSLNLDFRFINSLFPKKTHNRYFLETIDSILGDKEIDYKFIISHISKYIIEKFNTDEGKYFYNETLKSFGFLIYLRLIGVLFKQRKKVSVMEKFTWDISNYSSQAELFNDIFEKNRDFFDSSDKKTVFLMGFLSQKLLNVQYKKEERSPFINRLKGLKLGKKDIRRLLPELHNKFIEYDANYYREVFAIVSEYLVESGEKWKVSELDIPFYFSLGMNIERHINLKVNKEEGSDVE